MLLTKREKKQHFKEFVNRKIMKPQVRGTIMEGEKMHNPDP